MDLRKKVNFAYVPEIKQYTLFKPMQLQSHTNMQNKLRSDESTPYNMVDTMPAEQTKI